MSGEINLNHEQTLQIVNINGNWEQKYQNWRLKVKSRLKLLNRVLSDLLAIQESGYKVVMEHSVFKYVYVSCQIMDIPKEQYEMNEWDIFVHVILSEFISKVKLTLNSVII